MCALPAKYGDALLTSLTIQLLLLMFLVAPLRGAGVAGQEVVSLVLIVALMLNSLALSGNLTTFSDPGRVHLNAAAVVRRAQAASEVNIDLFAGAWLILTVTLAWIVATRCSGRAA